MNCITPTYDGSGQAMHPDVIDFKIPWNGYRYWMAMTPLTRGDVSTENPSILVSHDGVGWFAPITNPLVPLPVVGGFYSDPDLLYYNDTLYLLYRWVEGNRIDLLIRGSIDGRDWGKPILIFSTTIHNVSSPSVVWDGKQCLMYSTDSFGGLFLRTSPTPLGTYSEPIEIKYNGLRIWHLDVVEGVMIATDGKDYEWLGFSQDGFNWQFEPEPRILRGDFDYLYRASISKTEGGFDVWYTANKNNAWSIIRTFLPK